MKKTNLPPHWQIKRLGDVCKIYSGYGLPKNLQGQNDGKYPFYKVGDRSRNVQKGHVYLNFCENYINEEIVDSLRMKLFPVNTVVFAKIGEALKLNRRAIMKEKGVVDNNAIGIKAREGFCEDKYLYYFMNTVKLEDYSRATTVPSVRKTDIEEIQIPIPPLPEQEQIVAKIEELFSELDAGVENIKTAQEQLKVYRQSLLKWAFEGKLTNEDVKDGELPKGWRKEKLKNLTSILGDGLHGTPNYFENGEYYFINGNNLLSGKIFIKNNTKRVDEKEYNKHKKPLDESSVLVSINGTIGNTAFYRGEKIILGKSACYFNLLENVSKFYIRYFIMSPMFMQYANKVSTGSTIKNLSLKSMREMLIPLPCFDEQLKIVEELESRLTVCDKLEEDVKFSLARAESLRQSILKQAFEGKLVNFKGETDK